MKEGEPVHELFRDNLSILVNEGTKNKMISTTKTQTCIKNRDSLRLNNCKKNQTGARKMFVGTAQIEIAKNTEAMTE